MRSVHCARCRAACENVPRVSASSTFASAARIKLLIHSPNLAKPKMKFERLELDNCPPTPQCTQTFHAFATPKVPIVRSLTSKCPAWFCLHSGHHLVRLLWCFQHKFQVPAAPGAREGRLSACLLVDDVRAAAVEQHGVVAVDHVAHRH